MSSVRVPIKRLDPDLPIPAYAHPGDAGADLQSRVEVSIAPFQRVLVPTGIAMAIPTGYVGLVHPRSGLAHRHGLTIVNAPGTVDAGYRGEIMVNLINLDAAVPIHVRRGDRIAQIVIQRVEHASFSEADLDESDRGSSGHGSSGVSAFAAFAPHAGVHRQSTSMDSTLQGAADVQP